jgi:aromatic-amino-acid transaminase
MVADHALRPAEDDIIFGLAAQAQQAAERFGRSAIINATIGTLLEDDGSLVAFKSVYRVFKSLSDPEIAGYAGLAGDPAFLEAAVSAAFLDCRPQACLRAVATPGGTGAVRHAIANFTSPGDAVMTCNWYWQPYQTICEESGRRLVEYNQFTPEGKFDFPSYAALFKKLLAQQHRVLAIFNTPAHNPTGFSLSLEDWDSVLGLAREAAQDPSARVILLCDIAYIDFAGEGEREFMRKFSGLPENVIALFAYSTSKSYTMYGLRNGAIICATPSEEIAEEFFYSCAFSNRGLWSNGTKGAMATIAKIYTSESLFREVEDERDIYRAMLKARGDAFLSAARENEIPITPYCGGFFVSVPTENPQALCKKLIEKNLFTVPLQKGIRIALCATGEEKCRKMPELIKTAMEEAAKGE